MGMFDSVYATCPKCNKEVEFQSKAGECLLNRYSVDSVPPEIARSIDGDSEACEKCGEVLTIKITAPIQRVKMTVSNAEKYD